MPEEAMSWTLITVYLLAGFVFLAKGADWLVDGGTAIARKAGVSTLVVGLTVVAWGTSTPEVVVSTMAAWQGDTSISIGNVLGSNIANIGLVLGACALVLPKVMEQAMRGRELFWLLASLVSLWWVCLDSAITRKDALILLGIFLIHNLHLWLSARSSGRLSEEKSTAEPKSFPVPRLIVGIVVISTGAYLVVEGAVAGAFRFGMDEMTVGLTVVAIGTSLPELAAGLGGAFKGESDISIGNVVGSNVFNLLAVLGIVGLIQPLVPGAEADDSLRLAFGESLNVDFPIVLGFSLAAVLFPWLPGGGRLKGFLLLAGFVSYITWRVMGS
ncbi:MAG: cation:H+ antiporter [Planctomycetota bacterium]|jgi:cation:H+ antiporter